MTVEDIQTQRLILSSTREADAAFCLSLWLDPEVGRYLADPPRALADERYLRFAEGIEQEDDWFPFVTRLREGGRPIDTCSLVPKPDEPTRWDLGYCVERPFWRQGYASEMVEAMMAGPFSGAPKCSTPRSPRQTPPPTPCFAS